MSWIGAGIGAAIAILFGETIGAVVIGVVIGASIRAMLGKNNKEVYIVKEQTKLKLTVVKSGLDFEDGSRGNFFILKIEGTLAAPSDDYKVKTIIEIFDTTDEIEKIIYTNEETYSDGNDGVFFIERESTIPYEITSFDNNMAEQIFIDSLILPKKGERKLYFKYSIIDGTTGKKIRVLFKSRTHYNSMDGYEDAQEKRPTIERLMIKMAFVMSSIDASERQVISNMGRRMVEEDYPEDEREKNKKRLNNYIISAYEAAKDKKLNAQEILNEVNILCTMDVKYLMFDTCLDVAAADGVADKYELELAYYIAEKLDLDPKEYTKMIEKKLPITIHNKDEIEHTFEKGLGIISSMSNQEINEILKKEFKKWNQRVAHVDPSKREQAEKMLHKISELRKKYKN